MLVFKYTIQGWRFRVIVSRRNYTWIGAQPFVTESDGCLMAIGYDELVVRPTLAHPCPPKSRANTRRHHPASEARCGFPRTCLECPDLSPLRRSFGDSVISLPPERNFERTFSHSALSGKAWHLFC